MDNMEMARLLAQRVCDAGGTAYFVGGFVRDRLLGIENKDIDIEIHGLQPDTLAAILDNLGKRITIGESFGIYGLKGYDLDIAMPRTENATGRGHRDFEIFVDPFAGCEKAAMRRDFTINAMMQNVLTGEIVDLFGGREDLKDGILRHVNTQSFCEDALRVLRGAQFAARFKLTPAPETVELCRSIDLTQLSRERIEGELKKAMLKSEKPSVFFECLREMNALDYWFPELECLIGIEQDPEYHPEGDVWTHTMLALDTAAQYREKAEQPFAFMLSALCHDFGKAVTTEMINGRIHAYEHEIKGLDAVSRFMHRLTADKKLISYVLNMTELHMRPNLLASNNSAVKNTNRLFDLSVSPNDLIYLSAADLCGLSGTKTCPDTKKWLFERLEVFNEMMSRPFVSGKDLLDAGLKQDSSFKDILSYAHKLRLAGIDKKAALKQTLGYAASLKPKDTKD